MKSKTKRFCINFVSVCFQEFPNFCFLLYTTIVPIPIPLYKPLSCPDAPFFDKNTFLFRVAVEPTRYDKPHICRADHYCEAGKFRAEVPKTWGLSKAGFATIATLLPKLFELSRFMNFASQKLRPLVLSLQMQGITLLSLFKGTGVDPKGYSSHIS